MTSDAALAQLSSRTPNSPDALATPQCLPSVYTDRTRAAPSPALSPASTCSPFRAIDQSQPRRLVSKEPEDSRTTGNMPESRLSGTPVPSRTAGRTQTDGTLSRFPPVPLHRTSRPARLDEIVTVPRSTRSFSPRSAQDTGDSQRSPFREIIIANLLFGMLQEPEMRGSNPPSVSRSLQKQCAPALATAPKYR